MCLPYGIARGGSKLQCDGVRRDWHRCSVLRCRIAMRICGAELRYGLGRIKHLRGPGPSQGCGAPMGPQNLSINQHGNLSVNLFVLKTISFTFPFSFSPSFPPFSFFSLFFFFFLSQLLSFIQKHLLGAGPPRPWARAQRAHRLIRHESRTYCFC